MIAASVTNLDILMLVVILVLLVVLVFLAVAEMGLSRMSKPRAASLADQGSKSGKALKKLVDEPERWVNSVLLTVNICQTVQTSLTAIVAGRLFGGGMVRRRLGAMFRYRHAQTAALLAANQLRAES